MAKEITKDEAREEFELVLKDLEFNKSYSIQRLHRLIQSLDVLANPPGMEDIIKENGKLVNINRDMKTQLIKLKGALNNERKQKCEHFVYSHRAKSKICLLKLIDVVKKS